MGELLSMSSDTGIDDAAVEETKSTEKATEEEALAASKRLKELKDARNTLTGAGKEAAGSGIEQASVSNEKASGAIDELLSAKQSTRKEVSATTIGRMMGLVTLPELKVVEGKIDVLSSRLNNLFVKIDKMVSVMGDSATGSDLERIDVQIGALRTMLKEVLNDMKSGTVETSGERVSDAKILTNDE
jgi:hypothetical protein